MARRVKETLNINSVRLELIQRGYLRKCDIAKFVPCGLQTASKIFNTIKTEVECKGYENNGDVILASRMLEFIDKTKAEIVKDAISESRSVEG